MRHDALRDGRCPDQESGHAVLGGKSAMSEIGAKDACVIVVSERGGHAVQTSKIGLCPPNRRSIKLLPHQRQSVVQSPI